MTAACGGPKSPQDKLTVNDKKIDAIIAQMTLEEKVNMLHSKTNMSSAGVERLGIADMNYADGPFGIREEGVPNGNRQVKPCRKPRCCIRSRILAYCSGSKNRLSSST